MRRRKGSIFAGIVAAGWVFAAACGPSHSPPTGDGGTGFSPCVNFPTKAPAGGCLRDTDCDGERCRQAETNTPDDDGDVYLTCGADRGVGEDGDACTTAADCASGLCVVAGTCVAPCAGDDDCGDDERCAPVYVRVSDDSNAHAFACVTRIRVAPGIEVRRDGRPNAFVKKPTVSELTLPSLGDHGLAVVVPACGIDFTVTGLVTRDDPAATLFSSVDLGTAPPPANPLEPTNQPLSVLLPSAPASPLSDAGYALRVVATGKGDAEVVTLTGTPPGNVLDLDIFYVGGRHWVSTGDRGPAAVAAALDVVAERFAQAGVELGEIRQHDVVGALQERFSSIERDDGGHYTDAYRLFELSAGAPQPSIAVFFVQFMDTALGLSGGTPGPAGMAGTTASGVVLAVDLLPSEERVGPALAHELGHFMGLFHTTEPDGRVIEALPDTPICGLDRDGDGDGFLSATECAGEGADNLMFWQGTGDLLSADQAEILGSSFVLRAP